MKVGMVWPLPAPGCSEQTAEPKLPVISDADARNVRNGVSARRNRVRNGLIMITVDGLHTAVDSPRTGRDSLTKPFKLCCADPWIACTIAADSHGKSMSQGKLRQIPAFELNETLHEVEATRSLKLW
jgi:hypothetical protein